MPEAVLRVERRERGVVCVTLDRPAVRNAFNAELIGDLQSVFRALGGEPSVRTIVLAGSGAAFCGGADLRWMRAGLELSAAENLVDAGRMAEMFDTLDRCPKPVIGRVHGAALGGGAGLAAVCDVVVAEPATVFGFTETKLGIIPAVISPFVLAKIGISAARALWLSGARFGADRALSIGLVHEVVPLAELDARIEALCAEFATAAPGAIAAAKNLIAEVRDAGHLQSRPLTVRAIADARTTPEAQEGLRAFLDRRTPAWAEH